MMKKFFYLGILACAVLTSCTKPTVIGSDIIPAEDQLNLLYTDTLTILSHTERDDSLLTVKLNKYLLGSLSDPIFGKSYAGIYTQLRLPTNDLSFGPNPQLDSIILTLDHQATIYGDASAVHTVRVYELTQSMDPAANYYSYTRFDQDPTPIGELENFTPNSAVPIVVGGDTMPAHVRIPLSSAFGQKLLAQSGTPNFATNDAFLQFLKGIYIAPDTSTSFSNSLMQFDMLSSLSAVTLYYSNDNEDSLLRTFPINANSAISNHFKHNYSGTPIEQQLNDPGYDSVNYMQGHAGVRVRVNIPNAGFLDDIVINKAELVITGLDLPSGSIYIAPETVIPRVINAENEQQAIIDEALALFTPGYALGGSKQTVTINGITYNRYKINLAGYLNLLAMNKLEETSFVIRVFPTSSSPQRIVIGGGTSENEITKMQLRLIYTKL